MTSFVKILEGVEEYQSLSLLHEIMRDAPTPMPEPSREAQAEFIDEMAAKVETSSDFTAARKRSLQARLAAAREASVPGEIFFATQRIEERARVAKVALDDYYSRTARGLGESVSSVRSRLEASYEESRRERSMVAPEEWVAEYKRRPGNGGLPLDRHTAYAMWRIDNELAARVGRAEARPAVTDHVRVRGTGVSAVGYDPETGRLEVEFRSRPGQYYAYRDVPAGVHAEIVGSDHPTATFNRLVRNASDGAGFARYAYPTEAEADAAAVVRRCGSCGQFAGAGHGCPVQGSAEEVASTRRRARIQQQVVRARETVAGRSRLEYLQGASAVGTPLAVASAEYERLTALAELSPDTTMRHRQRQRLSARLFPYRGASGTFRSTALSTVRRIVDEEGRASVPVVAHIDRVPNDFNESIGIPSGTVSGRVLVESGVGGYTVTAAIAPGDSGDDQLKCTCLDYRENYDCQHVRQLVGDIGRRINQDVLSRPHAISDAVASVNAAAAVEHEESVAAQEAAVGSWAAGGDGVSYSGDEGAAAFQEDYAAAKARMAAGENPVPYMTENATDGLGARDGGRGVGVELEFSFPDWMSYEDREMNLSMIGTALYEADLTDDDRQQNYGSARHRGYRDQHYRGWSFEEDGSVDGEIVSPIMYDEPETWENIAKVCKILEDNGAVASLKTGSHVHVSTHNYDHTVENHTRLLGMFHEHEDEVYRLGSNPDRGTHRATTNNSYAQPNRRAGAGYSDIRESVRSNQGYVAINMQDCVRGRASDHAEFRVWDGTLKPEIIQAQIKMSLAMTEAAFRDTDYTPAGHTPFGSTRARHREEHGASRRLTGEQWRESTEGVRTLADRLFRRREDKAQMAGLFAATKWQKTN